MEHFQKHIPEMVGRFVERNVQKLVHKHIDGVFAQVLQNQVCHLTEKFEVLVRGLTEKFEKSMEKLILDRVNPQDTINAQFQAKFVAWEKRFAPQVEEVGNLRKEVANLRIGATQGGPPDLTPIRTEIQQELGRVREEAGLTRQKIGGMQDVILHKMASAFQQTNDLWQEKHKKGENELKKIVTEGLQGADQAIKKFGQETNQKVANLESLSTKMTAEVARLVRGINVSYIPPLPPDPAQIRNSFLPECHRHAME